MTEENETTAHPSSLLETWIKTASTYWENAAQMWLGLAGETSESDADTKSRVHESWDSARKSLQTLSTVMSETGDVEALFKGINALPEIFLKLTQTGLQGIFHLQQQSLEKVSHIGETTQAYSYENLDKEALKIWTELYEKEFRQFLNVPQLGLTRLYQERANRALDKFNLFQGAVGEFLHLLYLPVEKSFKVMQDQLSELAEEGKLPESGDAYYRMWIKVLEGHYMTLFKTPEYTRALTRALNALEEFSTARQAVLEDMLKLYPVPTQKDMDELYKEIYTLKKRLRSLEKQGRLESQTT